MKPRAVDELKYFLFCQKEQKEKKKKELLPATSDSLLLHLRANVSKYRPEVGKIKFLENPPKNYIDYPRYPSYKNIKFSFIR